MSIRKRYGSQSKTRGLRLLYYILIALLFIWLLASIIFKSNPLDLIKSSLTSFKSESPTEHIISDESSDLPLTAKDSLIVKLKNDLAICRGEKDYQKALVKIESSYLNMRDQASLNSDVILQIPAGSVVDVLYYDKKSFYLEGRQGNWARVLYAGKEGWVWGNYLEKLEEGDPALDSLSINN